MRCWSYLEQWIVEGVVCVGILGQHHVLAGLVQALDIRAAGRHWNVVVGGPVKKADGFVTYILICNIGREARRVEGYISGKRPRASQLQDPAGIHHTERSARFSGRDMPDH